VFQTTMYTPVKVRTASFEVRHWDKSQRKGHYCLLKAEMVVAPLVCVMLFQDQ